MTGGTSPLLRVMSMRAGERGLLHRIADDLRIGAVDDKVLRRGDRNLEALAAQSGDIVAQTVGIGGAYRSKFLHADLNRAGEVADFFLGAFDDRFLGAEADDNLRAERQCEQADHQEDQLDLEIQRWESICHRECASRRLFDCNSARTAKRRKGGPDASGFGSAGRDPHHRQAAQIDQRAQRDHDPQDFLEAAEVVDDLLDLLAEDIAEGDDDRH